MTLSHEQKMQFDKQGYLLIPGALTEEEVHRLRAALLSHFDHDRLSETQFLTDVFSRFPDLRWLLFHRQTLSVLRSLLGEDFVFLREVGAHLNNFASGWHRDTVAQERAGHTFHWADDYLMVEAAYYLQDNAPEFGGGLDIYPGSHNERNESSSNTQLSVPSRAGDLVIFHFRARHRSTPMRRIPAPPERHKVAIFIACSRNNRHVRSYHDFLESRPTGYDYLEDFAYPDDLLLQAKENGVNLV